MINLKDVSVEQLTLFDKHFDHLESYPNDIDRIRVVTKQKEKGPWFSRRWLAISWEQFWPKNLF